MLSLEKWSLMLFIVLSSALSSCGSLKSEDRTATNTEQVSSANKELLPLFNQIIGRRGIPGATGDPLLVRFTNSVTGTVEPVLVLDGNSIDSSIAAIRAVVNPMGI